MALLSYLLLMKSNQVLFFFSDVNYNSASKVSCILTAYTEQHQTVMLNRKLFIKDAAM